VPRLFAVGLAPFTVLVMYVTLYVIGLGTVTEAYTKYWAMDVRLPWAPVIDVIGRMVAGTANATEIANLLALIFLVAMLLIAIGRLSVFYHLYLWPTLLLILLRYYNPILLNGTMRYVLDFFPIFIIVGLWFSQHRFVRALWVSVGVVVQILVAFLFTLWMWIA
jgi:hypothetical protein